METPQELYEKLMTLAYTLEDKLEYDETPKGLEWGKIVNKLQEFKL